MAAQPAYPAALTVALEKVAFLPPDRVTDDTSVLTLKNLVLEPLCRWRDGSVGPGLFARWTHTPDGRVWRFHLRAQARFHDGQPCTAEDVIAFIDGLLGAVDTFGMPWPYERYLDGCRLRAVGVDCVELTAPEPFAAVLDILSEFYPCRLAADGQPVLGTGPYRVVALNPGVEATLQRVDDADGLPAQLRFVAFAAATERLRLLEDGGCDAALNLERSDTPIVSGSHLRWQRQANTLSVMSYLNCSSGLFRAAEARLAVNLAVDSGVIIDALFGGLGVRAATVVSPFHLGFREARIAPLVPDPARAARLFEAAQAAAPAGPVVLRTPLSMPHKAGEVTAMVADMLRRVGVDVRIDVEPDRPAYARQLGQKQMGDVAIFDSSPHSSFRVLSDKVSSTVRGTWWQGYANPRVDAAIADAHRRVDPVERAAAYGRCLAEVQRDPPWLYLFHPVDLLAARHGLDRLAIDAKGILTFKR